MHRVAGGASGWVLRRFLSERFRLVPFFLYLHIPRASLLLLIEEGGLLSLAAARRASHGRFVRRKLASRQSKQHSEKVLPGSCRGLD